MAKRTLTRQAVRWEANLLAATAIRVMINEGAVNREGWTEADGIAVEARMSDMADAIEIRSTPPRESS